MAQTSPQSSGQSSAPRKLSKAVHALGVILLICGFVFAFELRAQKKRQLHQDPAASEALTQGGASQPAEDEQERFVCGPGELQDGAHCVPTRLLEIKPPAYSHDHTP